MGGGDAGSGFFDPAGLALWKFGGSAAGLFGSAAGLEVDPLVTWRRRGGLLASNSHARRLRLRLRRGSGGGGLSLAAPTNTIIGVLC